MFQNVVLMNWNKIMFLHNVIFLISDRKKNIFGQNLSPKFWLHHLKVYIVKNVLLLLIIVLYQQLILLLVVIMVKVNLVLFPNLFWETMTTTVMKLSTMVDNKDDEICFWSKSFDGVIPNDRYTIFIIVVDYSIIDNILIYNRYEKMLSVVNIRICTQQGIILL